MTQLSVVIPTYNRKDSLRRTLDGLSRQSYPVSDFEVVVVSDGSTDGTDEMLTEYAASAPYTLRAISQPNSGPSVARNRGFRAALYEVIVFLDDDVEPVPEFLARHAAHHETDEKIVVLGPMSPDPASAAQEPAWIAWEHAKLQKTYDLFRSGGAYADKAPVELHFYSGNASVRRRWLEAVNGFDVNFKRQEDVELATRMVRVCGVHFVWDFAADGLHRPKRTLASWLRIPASYGELDAERVRAGALKIETVQWFARQRNGASRRFTEICLRMPILIPITLTGAKMVIPLLHRVGGRQVASALLSGLYHLCYTQAFQASYAPPPAMKEPLQPAPSEN